MSGVMTHSRDIHSLLDLIEARNAFYARAWFTEALSDYLKTHGLNLDRLTVNVGAVAVVPILDLGNGLFTWGKIGLDELGFVCEALDEDGEVDDLVAWRLDQPKRPLSMFGRVGLVGVHAHALDARTVLHASVLDYLKAGCRGVAAVGVERAAVQLAQIEPPPSAEPWDRPHAN